MSKLFMRVVEVVSGAVKMNNTDLDIQFDVPFDDDLEPNLSEISVYNLSKNTINQLKNGQDFAMNAGYKEDKGLVLKGRIVSSTTKPSSGDTLTTIKVLDSVPYNAKKMLKKAYTKNIKADAILRDLAQRVGIKIAVLKLPTNTVYKKGYNINGNIVEEMQKIANECGASCYISRGQIYIRSLKEGDNYRFNLNASTGLIGSPEYFERTQNKKVVKGYKIKSLLQHRMHAGAIIYLESFGVKATLRVQSGKHTCEGNTYYTEVEALL